MKAIGSTPDGAFQIHGVLVTHERPLELARMLETLSGSSRLLDTLVIVDNSRERSDLAESRLTNSTTDYIAPGDNLGPAGGLALGISRVLSYARSQDWLLLLDDDDPPEEPSYLEHLAAFGARCVAADPSTGGVGLNGSRFDSRRGEIQRPPDSDLAGAVEVDCIGGNAMPLYRVSAVRTVGVPLARLFFGFEELEYGLRLRSSGFHLYCDGEVWRHRRELHERLGLPSSLRSWRQAAVTWRSYYERRNLIFILNARGAHAAALRVSTIAIGKPVLNLLLSPRGSRKALWLGVRAVRDAWFHRLGRRVEPA
jgi:GT2 family glycosyltransferase